LRAAVEARKLLSMQDALVLRNLSLDAGAAPRTEARSRRRLSLVHGKIDTVTDEQDHRVLTTILFVDVVASTEKLTLIGDRAFARLLSEFRAAVRSALALFRGHELRVNGDGVLATFDSPSRALRCCGCIHAATRELGIVVRAGVHAGEVEREEHDINGIAVHVSARISALAGAGETLASGTIRDLVAGSGLSFEERGTHVLRGVPGQWLLYAAAPCV
jgi:class 3 adenylate cyclase